MGRSHSHIKPRQPVRRKPKAGPSLLDRVLLSDRPPVTDEEVGKSERG